MNYGLCMYSVAVSICRSNEMAPQNTLMAQYFRKRAEYRSNDVVIRRQNI